MLANMRCIPEMQSKLGKIIWITVFEFTKSEVARARMKKRELTLASSDAIVDGGTFHWEKHRHFKGLSEERTSTLSSEDYEKLESEGIEKNNGM